MIIDHIQNERVRLSRLCRTDKYAVKNLLDRIEKHRNTIRKYQETYDAALQNIYRALGAVAGAEYQRARTATAAGVPPASAVTPPAHGDIGAEKLVATITSVQRRRGRINAARIEHWVGELKRATWDNDAAAFYRAITGLRAEMPKE